MRQTQLQRCRPYLIRRTEMQCYMFKKNHLSSLMGLVPKSFYLVILALIAHYFVPTVHAQEVPGGCGFLSVTGRFGPYDYRAERYVPENTYRSHQALLQLVEGAHFTPPVEALLRGNTSARPGPDMSYTLHAFPNHHRALMAMVGLSEKEKTPRPSGTPYSVECWFTRAIVFRPDDNIVRMIYANFLIKAARVNEAEQQLEVVAVQAKDNAFTHNNIGLIYFDMKNYEKALIHAHKAYELGLGIPTLQNQLKAIGKWSPPISELPTEPVKQSP